MKTRTCRKCKIERPLTDFHLHSDCAEGRTWTCKFCRSVYKKRWREKNKERLTKADSVYSKTEVAKQSRVKYAAKIRKEQPAKMVAYNAVYYAVKTGKLPHPSTLKCASCGKPAKQYHHPFGYEGELKLKVQPVCFSCHSEVTPRKRLNAS